MRKPRLSLFTKTLFWLFINLALLPAILLVGSTLFNHQIILHDTLSMLDHTRMRKSFMLVAHDLERTPEEKWNAALAHFATDYRVDLVMIFADGSSYSSRPIELDESILKKVRNSIDQAQTLKREQSMGRKIPLLPEGNPIHPDLLMQTTEPNLFWTGILIDLPHGSSGDRQPAMIASVSNSVTGNGFLFDPWPWLLMLGGVVILSVLLWLPVIHHITRPLGRMTLATERIARGDFRVALEEGRQDEIGRLAGAINRMSAQLSHLLKGHKRFLGDVAHELGSPIGRIQLGLGALEQRVDERNRERVREIMEEADHMSALVQELLALSRVELDTRALELAETPLLAVVEAAAKREYTPAAEVRIEVDPRLRVVASANLLIRAVSNLLRNSIKYAGQDGPIVVEAWAEADQVILEVRDQGPGVAEVHFTRLFEPFFRPEPSRDRDSGGVGLGLAIVKTCVESCHGTLSVRNLEPRGFAVTLRLLTAGVGEA
nr:HAMP domain-containing sensor histidine kinase [uncultured Holophaga sp.]